MCEPTFQCAAGFDYRLGECKAARCAADSDCCPGQKCNASAGFCADQTVSCTADTDCTQVPGQSCIEVRGRKACGYANAANTVSPFGTESCAHDADCAAGTSCFDSRCVIAAPCGGGCPSGQVCDIDSNTCFAMPTCAAQCAQGQMLVIADPDHQSGPHCCKVECACATLPAIPPGQYGYYASLGLKPSEVVVSAYDKTYGDLVLAHFGLDGTPGQVEYIDGFPSTGPISGNPSGPRGGRADQGPDVGLYTSLAVDAQNVVHIAYYDRSNGQLKYANDAGGRWNVSVVDQSGNNGAYTSLAIGPDGNPRIAYMLLSGTSPTVTGTITGLRFAAAHVPSPTSPADWDVTLVDAAPLVPPACNGACPANEACIQTQGGPTCVPTDPSCNPGCAANQACVSVAPMAAAVRCVDTIPLLPIDDLVEGTGLFASLALTSTGAPVVAYYDRTQRVLRLARGAGDGHFSTRTIDAGPPGGTHDVGQHASVATGPGGIIGVAYADTVNDRLLYLEIPQTGAPVQQIVDDGVSRPDRRMVGEDASLIFDAAGQPAVAYQDATNIDLRYARRTGTPPVWSSGVLHGGPGAGAMMSMPSMRGLASGFYASQKRLDAKAYVANVDVTFDPQGDLVIKLGVLQNPLQ